MAKGSKVQNSQNLQQLSKALPQRPLHRPLHLHLIFLGHLVRDSAEWGRIHNLWLGIDKSVCDRDREHKKFLSATNVPTRC